MKENNILIYYYQNNSNFSHVQEIENYLKKRNIKYFIIGLKRNNKGFYYSEINGKVIKFAKKDNINDSLNKDVLNKNNLNKNSLNKNDLNKNGLNKKNLNKEDINKVNYKNFEFSHRDIKFEEFTLVLSIGGDGTFLFVANEIRKYDIPIIGINKGKLGFLTWYDCDKVCSFLDEYFEGNYIIEPRMMLEGHINKNGRTISVSAFNEIALTKYVLSTPIDIGLYIDGKFLSRLKGDGVIVSTPTGSTGYSLSAGGPIISPLINAIIITPICPHSFTMKPIIIKDSHTISIKLLSKKKAIVTMDGQRGEYLKSENEILIKKSKHKTLLVRRKNFDFFDVISKKLKWGQ